MHLINAYFMEELYWRIDDDDPNLWDIDYKSVRGIVHPYYSYLKNKKILSYGEDHNGGEVFKFEGSWYIRSRSVTFFTNGLTTVESFNPTLMLTHLMELINAQVDSCKQFLIPNVPNISGGSAKYTPTNINVPEIVGTHSGWENRYVVDCSVSYRSLVRSKAQFKERKTYEEIFLTALRYFHMEDYRNTLLYSGMSLEISLLTHCDKILEEEKIDFSNGNQTNFNFIEIPTAGGNQIIKDPVYDYIKEVQSFEKKLTVLLFYCTGKYISKENNTLYQAVRKLYTTRNKIAHLGVLPINAEIFRDDNPDAGKALHICLEFFQWLNLGTNYSLPIQDDEGYYAWDGILASS